MEDQFKIAAIGNDGEALDSLNEILREAGYQVSTTEDGPTALDILGKFKPDLIILDASGLNDDGFKTLLLIRQRWDIPVIMLSNADDSALVAEALSMGADDYVTKPFSRKEFTALIRAKLGRSLTGASRVKVQPQNSRPSFSDRNIQNEKKSVTTEKHPCIMAVDDEPVILMIIKRALQTASFEVVPAADGNAALELFEKHKPDLVLLDIMMPGLDGFHVLDRIRQQSNVPVIMLTARHEIATLRDSLTTGADDFITKPFGTMELVARIRAKLRRYRPISAN